ncbi:efflux RND transporter periplasmic adaptor subunit [Clostridium sp. D2Q-14]|uniref:efflux RND transporter periplasmic adaptor subunit n=1 Tax=Anaeromonas gelatinilytica TaxID=2683194 RepID=UPI00193AFC98|nr:efflux RND transporter periplasmic adaptor subunit [Anaeromonas gelatinilytica]MBS4534923.1 efflux RND transporter periplasmic adaptor subunit [Anaeromonas gelatinilytica]
MKKKLTILMIILIGLLVGISACTDEETGKEDKAKDKVSVEVETVSKNTISNEITLNGRALPSSEMMIMPQEALKVNDIKVNMGSKVKEGDVLFTLEKEDSDKTIDIKTSVEGRVGAINIKEGKYTSSIQPSMVIVVEGNPMTISLNVSENLLGELFIGKEGVIDISALEEEGLKGKIASISSTPGENTQLYGVNIVLNEELRNLKPGMIAKVVLDTDVRKDVLVVRSEAILNNGEKDIVFTEEEGIAKEVEIETGLDVGDYTEIKSGLKSGDKVIIKGQNYIEEGSKVDTVRGEE